MLFDVSLIIFLKLVTKLGSFRPLDKPSLLHESSDVDLDLFLEEMAFVLFFLLDKHRVAFFEVVFLLRLDLFFVLPISLSDMILKLSKLFKSILSM